MLLPGPGGELVAPDIDGDVPDPGFFNGKTHVIVPDVSLPVTRLVESYRALMSFAFGGAAAINLTLAGVVHIESRHSISGSCRLTHRMNSRDS